MWRSCTAFLATSESTVRRDLIAGAMLRTASSSFSCTRNWCIRAAWQSSMWRISVTIKSASTSFMRYCRASTESCSSAPIGRSASNSVHSVSCSMSSSVWRSASCQLIPIGVPPRCLSSILNSEYIWEVSRLDWDCRRSCTVGSTAFEI